MKSSGSVREDHLIGKKSPAGFGGWRHWARAAGVNIFKGACTAVGTAIVSLLVWWIQNR